MSDKADLDTVAAAAEQKAAAAEARREARKRTTQELPHSTLMDFADPEELLMLDPETLDPEKHYRLVRDTPQRLARMATKGYRPVSVSEDGVRPISDSTGMNADDRIRVADTILVCCSKDRYLERRRRLSEFTNSRLKQPEGSFRKKARRAKINITTKEGPS